MPWHERMGPASFRDVRFYVDVAELAGGRKTVQHEYPLRDDAYVEDLGRRGRAFSIDGYVIGPEYFTQRDALLKALEQSGLAVASAELAMVPKGTVEIADEGVARRVVRLVEGLEEVDDVQEVYANFDIPESVLEAVAS